MVHIVGLGGSLLGFWLVMSGYFTPLLLTLGAASVLLVLYIAQRMDVCDHETFPLHLKQRIFGYWGWLAKEIFKANIDVARIVLSPRMALSAAGGPGQGDAEERPRNGDFRQFDHTDAGNRVGRYRGRAKSSFTP